MSMAELREIQSFKDFIDEVDGIQQEAALAMESTDNTNVIFRSQGAVEALKRVKAIVDIDEAFEASEEGTTG